MPDAAPMFPESYLQQRRAATCQQLASVCDAFLVAAGNPIGKPGGLDACYEYIPHPEYYWLTGFRRAGAVLAYRKSDGFTHFTNFPSAGERLADGASEVPPGEDIGKLDEWIKSTSGETLAVLGSGLPDVASDPDRDDLARQNVNVVRRRKDASELAILDKAIAATKAGYEKITQLIAPGMTERQLEIELEAEFFRHGADTVGYDSIIAAGSRASILHCMPENVAVAEGDLVLVDAGAQVDGYTTDITRTYPASGKFSARQQAFFDTVEAAIDACIAQCKPGVEWHDIQRIAARTIADGLRDMGIFRVSTEQALDTQAISMFFPHGVGHFVGLAVRDVGGYALGREPDRECIGIKVRVDLPLESGHLMTVEPGLYFVDGILDNPDNRKKFAEEVNWDKLEEWRGVGGARLEDDVLITDGEPQNLTAGIPR